MVSTSVASWRQPRCLEVLDEYAVNGNGPGTYGGRPHENEQPVQYVLLKVCERAEHPKEVSPEQPRHVRLMDCLQTLVIRLGVYGYFGHVLVGELQLAQLSHFHLRVAQPEQVHLGGSYVLLRLQVRRRGYKHVAIGLRSRSQAINARLHRGAHGLGAESGVLVLRGQHVLHARQNSAVEHRAPVPALQLVRASPRNVGTR